jgi:hypothetical protein
MPIFGSKTQPTSYSEHNMASDTTAKIAAFGNSWTPTITQELTAMYEPLHAAKSQQSSKGVQVQKNVKYGPAARNRLDVSFFCVLDSELVDIVRVN